MDAWRGAEVVLTDTSLVWLASIIGWVLLTTRLVFDHICDSRLTASVPATKASNDNTRNRTDHTRNCIEPPVLSPEEKVRVGRGELVTKSFRNDGGINRGVACQMIKAPPSTIFAALTSFADYPRMVDDVQAADVYSTSTEAHTGTQEMKVRFRVGYGPAGLTFDLHHSYNEALGQLTWTLDRETGQSMFKSNEGFWVVRPGPTPNSSIVYYSIAVELNGWIPSWVNGFVAAQGIPRAVAWVKKESEIRASAQVREAAASAARKEMYIKSSASPSTVHPLARCFLVCFGQA